MMQITHKLDLAEANLIKRALEAYREDQLSKIALAGGPGKLPATAVQVGQIETLLIRDFSWTRPRNEK